MTCFSKCFFPFGKKKNNRMLYRANLFWPQNKKYNRNNINAFVANIKLKTALQSQTAK